MNRHVAWQRDPRVLWRGVGEGVLLLPPGSADSVTLSGSAGRLWALLDQPLTIPQLVERLAGHYAMDEASIESAVADTVEVLAERQAVVAVGPRPEGGDR